MNPTHMPTETIMEVLELTRVKALGRSLPAAARDLALNLEGVLGEGGLEPATRLEVALASAHAARAPALASALAADGGAALDAGRADDARAAAALMSMTNVIYRFRHLIEKPSYAQMRPRLRMNRMAALAGPKLDFELAALAVSAIHGCGQCLKAHEAELLKQGASEEQVHDAVRIAAVVHGFASALAAGLVDAA
jgi:alkyl hydroperoxide reductase subunit D